MLTVFREMAHSIARQLAHLDADKQRLEPRRQRRAAGRGPRRGAGAGDRRRPAGGRAHARAARGAARIRRRRRRRLRPGPDPRRRRRRPARRRRRGARGRPPRGAAAEPAPPRGQPLPLLHQLHRLRQRASTQPRVPAAAGGPRRLGPRRRRRGDAQGPRPHRRARGRGGALRGRRRGHQPRRRRHARADRRAPTPGSAAAAPASLAVAAGEGLERLFAELGAHVVPGGETLNPSTYELLAGIHEVAGRGGPRPAQLLERDHGRRARLRALREAGPGGAGDLAAGEPAGPGRARPRAPRPTRTPSGWRRRSAAIATGGVAPAARDDAQGRFRKGDAVGFADGEIVAWGGAGSTLAATIEQPRRGRRDRHRDRRRGRADPARRRSTPTSPTGSRSRPTRAASRAGGGCSPPSSARRFAGAAELTGAELRDAPVHWPRPERPRRLACRRSRASGRSSPRRPPRPASRTVGDLLFRFPHSHRDRQIVAGGRASSRADRRPSWSRCSATRRAPSAAAGSRSLSVKVGDDSGHVRATWFNQPWVAPKLTPGTRLLLTGMLATNAASGSTSTRLARRG